VPWFRDASEAGSSTGRITTSVGLFYVCQVEDWVGFGGFSGFVVCAFFRSLFLLVSGAPQGAPAGRDCVLSRIALGRD
jgi:hypothetical protein